MNKHDAELLDALARHRGMYSDEPYAFMPFIEQNRRLWEAGCQCAQPLNGWRPHVGPRCRTCGVVANAWDAYEEQQARLI